jgi:hypothetical protein
MWMLPAKSGHLKSPDEWLEERGVHAASALDGQTPTNIARPLDIEAG